MSIPLTGALLLLGPGGAAAQGLGGLPGVENVPLVDKLPSVENLPVVDMLPQVENLTGDVEDLPAAGNLVNEVLGMLLGALS